MPITSSRTAKLFLNGRSQAVRLPKEFRFEGELEVAISREGNKVILEPIAATKSLETWEEFLALAKANPVEDFLLDRDQIPPQERDLFSEETQKTQQRKVTKGKKNKA